MNTTYAKNLERLAAELDMFPQQLRLEARKAWFPVRTARGFNVEAVREARQCNVKPRRTQQPLPPLSAEDRARLFPPPPDPRVLALEVERKRRAAMAQRVATLPAREIELAAAKTELVAARAAWLADPDTGARMDRYVKATDYYRLELQVEDLKREQKILNQKE